MPTRQANQTIRDKILDKDKVKWFRGKLRSWHTHNARAFPWREINDPYRILIAEILLQATFAAKVVPIYEEFVRRYPTVQCLSQATVNEIEEIIRPLGLLSRAHTLLKIGSDLVELYGGIVPSERDKLKVLPRVGDYTIGAIQSFGFDLRAGIPDTNVIRLLQRFFGLYNPRKSHRGSPPRALRIAAYEVLPARDSRTLNYAMLDFGALICTSVKPKCDQCPLSTRCVAYISSEITPA